MVATCSFFITGEVFTGDSRVISTSFCGDKRLPHKLYLIGTGRSSTGLRVSIVVGSIFAIRG